ncbi:hypothetical protein EVAR_60647_1 [Eumeta japonica]|uniref:Uncharacterized protein n=1 Tax=Eumeta variegata TaxID=151549 RepID=A0A4C1ZIQ6_EUMVA|nr:hypothetical protein EVAR_60647_1 [Eumeta japonica]
MIIRRPSLLLAFWKSAASWANSRLFTTRSIDIIVRMSSPSGPAEVAVSLTMADLGGSQAASLTGSDSTLGECSELCVCDGEGGAILRATSLGAL